MSCRNKAFGLEEGIGLDGVPTQLMPSLDFDGRKVKYSHDTSVQVILLGQVSSTDGFVLLPRVTDLGILLLLTTEAFLVDLTNDWDPHTLPWNAADAGIHLSARRANRQ